MFEDALLESAHRPRRTRRGLTTLLSAAAQSALAGLAVLLPLLYTDALPAPALRSTVYAPVALGSPPPPRVVDLVDSGRRSAAPPQDPARLTAPLRIPDTVATIFDPVPAGAAPAPPDLGLGSGLGPGSPGGVLGGVPPLGPAATPSPLPPPPPAQKQEVSEGVMAGRLIHRVQPAYPPLAIQTGTQGEVLLRAVITPEGVIEDLQVVSGHPLLVQAATDAVRQWRYRSYLLNRRPVAVETEIRVVFRLNR